MDDNINEREEVFVLVARILGQAADVACFQQDEYSPCKSEGHIGGTRLRIRDDDGKFVCNTILVSSYIHGVLSNICSQTCLLDFLNECQQ